MATVTVEVRPKAKKEQKDKEQKRKVENRQSTLEVPQSPSEEPESIEDKPPAGAQNVLWQAPERNALKLRNDPKLPDNPPLICPNCCHKEHLDLQEAQTTAIKGVSTSQMALAKIYEDVEQLKKRFDITLNQSKADILSAAWLRKAALKGLVTAQKALARKYLEKLKDEKRAFYWFYMAATQGDIESQLEVAFGFLNGVGIDANIDDAVDWFENVVLAETDKYEAEKEKARKMLGQIYCLGSVVSENLDEKVLAEFGKHYFEETLKIAIESHDREAQWAIGICYTQGKGVAKDLKLAAEWFKNAADQGLGKAHYCLGILLKLGKGGVPKDLNAAFVSFKKAALHRLPEGQFELGLAYKQGSGTKQDDDEANNWFSNAAELNHAEAQLELAFAFRDGRGVLIDKGQAFQWCRSAAALGLDKAQIALAEMYIDGIGVAKDLKKASEILNSIPLDPDFEYEPDEWNPVLDVERVRQRISDTSKRCCVIL